MYKKVIVASLAAASLFFGGCGEESTSCRFDVQNDIDTGDFDAAISALDGSCADAYTPSDRYFNLASAYMGKAGFGAIDVVNMVLDAGESDESAYSALIRSVGESRREDSLQNLEVATTYYLRSMAPEVDPATLSVAMCPGDPTDTRAQNACFYIGFAETFAATTTVTYLTEDIDGLVNALNNNTETPLDMKASIDALAWAVGEPLVNNSTITAQQVTIAGAPYKHLEVLQNGKLFYRLADAAAPSKTSSTVVTDGYCDTNGERSACSDIAASDGSITNAIAGCYACPIALETNVANLLVDTLNGGTDVLFSVTDDEDIRTSIDEFVQDITQNSAASATTTDITLDQIINYLNK